MGVIVVPTTNIVGVATKIISLRHKVIFVYSVQDKISDEI